MKKLVLALICLLSWGAAFAAGLLPGGYDVTKLPKPLPYTYGGVTYHHAIAWPHTGTSDHWVAYYNTALTQDGNYLILTENDACFYQLEPNGPVSGNPNAWCGAVSVLVNECAKTYFSDVDIVATSSGTLYGTGSCNSINYSTNDVLISAATFLSFPIPYDLNGNPFTAYTAPVSSVMDHSMPNGPYSYDGVVVAFNGETGDNQSSCYNPPSCSVTGYSKTGGGYFLENQNGQKVINYPGANGHNDTYLFYDGHPGYDYSFTQGTHIVAPANGTLCVATTYTAARSPANVWRDTTNCPLPSIVTEQWQDTGGFNAFYIFHSSLSINGSADDYLTVFLHNDNLESSVRTNIETDGYVTVSRNQHIAQVGDTGSSGAYHMHLEVYKKNVSTGNWDRIDPYGDGTNNVLWRY